MNLREKATVIAALRHWQADNDGAGLDSPLNDEEINKLAERLAAPKPEGMLFVLSVIAGALPRCSCGRGGSISKVSFPNNLHPNNLHTWEGQVEFDVDMFTLSGGREPQRWVINSNGYFGPLEAVPVDNVDDEKISPEGVILSDNGVIEWPDDDGTIRRRDIHGNCEEIRRPGDDGYEEWKDLFPATDSSQTEV